MTRFKWIALLVLFLAALALRLSPGNWNVIFPYDQARDVLIAKHIIEGRDLPLMGPVSDIPGVHHGAIYYWLITPLYALDHYDPSLVVVVFSLFSALGVFTYFFALNKLFEQRVAWIGTILYAFSFLTTSYARWISNPPLVIPLMPLFVWLLFELVTKKRYAFWVGLILGLFVQLELVLGYLLVAVGFWILKTKRIKPVAQLLVGFALGAMPLILSELKFGFQGIKGLLSYTLGQSTSQLVKTSNAMIDVADRYGLLLRDTVAGLTAPLAFLLILGLCLLVILRWKGFSEKIQTILSLLFSLWIASLLLFGIGKPAVNFFLVGEEFVAIALVAFVLGLWLAKRKVALIIMMVILVGLQLRLFISQTQNKRAYVQVQQGVLLSEREEVIAAIYKKTGDKPFTISVFGTPYGVRSAWSYYLWLYRSIHGTIMPSWYGFAANGYMGDELLPKVDAPSPIQVTVYEPEFSVDPETEKTFTDYQNAHTILLESFEINHHVVQIRRPSH